MDHTLFSQVNIKMFFVYYYFIFLACRNNIVYSFVDYCDEAARKITWASGGSEAEADRVLTTNDDPETEESSWRQSHFDMDFGCPHTFDSIIVKNSRWGGKSAKKLR